MIARTLLILRHASAANEPANADEERPLTQLGRSEATQVGKHVAEWKPEQVLCSTALRTRQTWQLISPELETEPEIDFEPAIYQANADTLRELIWLAAGDARTLLLIGHNPAVHELAWGLLGDRAPQHFPPAALAVVRFKGEWTDL
ncbi:MAG: histidine phosphatase family protein [Kibdelosporangium sp.]